MLSPFISSFSRSLYVDYGGYALIHSSPFIISESLSFSSHIYYPIIHNLVKIAIRDKSSVLSGRIFFSLGDEKINFNNIPMKVDRKLSKAIREVEKIKEGIAAGDIDWDFKVETFYIFNPHHPPND